MASVRSLQSIAMDCFRLKVLPSIPWFVPYHPIAFASVGLRQHLLDDLLSSAEDSTRIAGAVEILIRQGRIDTFEFRKNDSLDRLNNTSAQQVVDVLLLHGKHLRKLYVDPHLPLWCRKKEVNKVVKLFKRVPNLLHLTLSRAPNDLATILALCPLLQVLKLQTPIYNRVLRNQVFSNSYENLRELRLPEQLRVSEVNRVFPNLKTLVCDVLELDEVAPGLESLRVWKDIFFYHQEIDYDPMTYSGQPVPKEEYHRMAKCLPNLTSLEMPVHQRMGDMEFLTDFKSLRSMAFTLSGYWDMEYSHLVVILPKLRGLQELTLSCYIVDLDLYKIARDCPDLSRLQIDVIGLTYSGNDQEFRGLFPRLRVLILTSYSIPEIKKRAHEFLVYLKYRRHVHIDVVIEDTESEETYEILQN